MGTGTREEWIENRPSRGLRLPDLRELWQYRELAYFLALRDLKVRYKQAALGAGWAIFQPVVLTVVFTLVFTRFARVETAIPYPIFALSGLIAWTYVAGSLTRSTQILVANTPLVTKVYFPRLLAPVASALPGMVDLLLSLLVLAVVMPFYDVRPTWAILTLPLWLAAMLVVVLGVSLLLGTLNVRYRDVTHGITLLVQLWIFVSPVAYPSDAVPEAWRVLYFLNPVAGVLEGFRWALAGAAWPGSVVFLSLGTALVLLAAGVLYFQHAERRFADVI
ncbi:MAG TPA: ABC transporter permease [Actinomycetota bacterium]